MSVCPSQPPPRRLYHPSQWLQTIFGHRGRCPWHLSLILRDLPLPRLDSHYHVEVPMNLCARTPLRASPGGTGAPNSPKNDRKIQRDRSTPSRPPLPRHSSDAPFSTSFPDKQPPLPSPHACYFGSRVTAEGLAGLDTQSSCSGPRPAGDFQKCPSGGRREEEGGRKFPSPLPLVRNSPAPSSLFFRKIHGLAVSLEWKWVFVPLCASSAALPCLHRGAVFGLPPPPQARSSLRMGSVCPPPD